MPYENLPEANLLRALIETGEGIIEASRALLDIVEGRIQVDAIVRETLTAATARKLDQLQRDYDRASTHRSSCCPTWRGANPESWRRCRLDRILPCRQADSRNESGYGDVYI
jgi:hypothetical protein